MGTMSVEAVPAEEMPDGHDWLLVEDGAGHVTLFMPDRVMVGLAAAAGAIGEVAEAVGLIQAS